MQHGGDEPPLTHHCKLTSHIEAFVDFLAYSRCRMHVAAIAAACALASCGGGGGSAAPSSPASAASRPVDQSDLQIAQGIYSGGARTPTDFYSDPAPSGHTYVSTAHLKNADVDAGATSAQPLYELCTNDWNQALAWSETSAQSAAQYANLVETNDDARYFEFGRIRAGTPDFYVRSRVFKCTYVDRSAANLRISAGPAGQLNQRPLTATDLRMLSEYLWHFTPYNNFGHVVLKSIGASTSSGLAHTLYIGNLTRNGLSSTCDRIDVITWRHTVDSNGQLHLDLQTLWSFGARESAGAAQICS